ncbi:MAG TPA: aminotransferase class V-fold PLP-dependent enzyme [Bryobacteraceae bacterium]|jgi:selenocysteine lyase/cysteine desulfurase|nr:aminotransferase class V-fold PLP-dependent enzyme [Bryobacteraceae bacterium]
MGEPDWNTVRQEFPALAGRTYLNTATYGQLPRRAVEAVKRHLDHRDEGACQDFLSWFDDLAQLRAALARLLHVQAQDIAFTTTASQALSLVMSGFDWREGDEILTLEHEFPNQLYAAQSELGVRGIECAWESLESSISPRTRLVLLSTVNYVTGLRPNLAEIVASLRRRGIFVYLDGTQSIGALDFDCGAIQPDVLAVDAYKWMISPNGAGFFYVRPDVRAWLRPNVIGWRSHWDWRNVDDLHHGAPEFSGDAEKYEGGMLAFPSLYGMQGSVGLLEQLGPAAIEARVLYLSGLLRKELQGLGAEMYPHRGDHLPSQIVLARLPGTDSSLLARELAAQNIFVSARKGYLRISTHFYNDERDVMVLIEALRASTGK